MKWLITGFFMLGVQLVSAQATNAPVRSLSLMESIRIALEHNFDVKIEQKSVDIARSQLRLTYGAFRGNPGARRIQPGAGRTRLARRQRLATAQTGNGSEMKQFALWT